VGDERTAQPGGAVKFPPVQSERAPHWTTKWLTLLGPITIRLEIHIEKASTRFRGAIPPITASGGEDYHGVSCGV